MVRQQALPAYNIETAVDTEHALIVRHAVVLDASDIRCLRPMAEAAKRALGVDSFQIVADAGYSDGEQVAHCEAAGMIPHVPVMRTVNNQGDGTQPPRSRQMESVYSVHDAGRSGTTRTPRALYYCACTRQRTLSEPFSLCDSERIRVRLNALTILRATLK